MMNLNGWLARLRRVTSSGRFIPEIDGLRFIAIASVVLFHINGDLIKHMEGRIDTPGEHNLLNELLVRGNFGVQLFFAISGFVLGLPFIQAYSENRARPSLRGYYLRRVTRIEPPLVINLTLYLFILHFVKHDSLRSLLPHYAASMTYSHNLIYRDVSTINFVTWSLEIEAQFYLTAPFLVALLSAPKRGLRVGLTIFVMAVWAAGSWYAIERVPLIGLTLAGHLHYFLCGFLLAAVHLKNRGNAGHSYAWDAIALVAWCLLVRLLFSYTVWSAAAKPFVVLIAYIAMFRGRVASAIITFPVLAVIGGMCYTIYLYHSFMIATLGRFTFRMVVTRSYELNVLIQAVVLGAGVALWGGVLFLLFEKPFMYRDWPAAAWARAKRIVGRPIEADAKNDVNE